MTFAILNMQMNSDIIYVLNCIKNIIEAIYT
jgi:hypothetical protein